MLKPLHYHTLIDLAYEILTVCMTREEDEHSIAYDFNLEEAVEVTKRHLPEPLSKDQLVKALADLIGAGPPNNSCTPFKLAFILHHTLIEDCGAEVH